MVKGTQKQVYLKTCTAICGEIILYVILKTIFLSNKIWNNSVDISSISDHCLEAADNLHLDSRAKHNLFCI